MLLLLVLGAAGTNAQVRIGGDGVPNEAAVLDLNVDGTTTGTKGLALPRVSLSSDDVILPGVTENLDGMLVYNTSGSLPAGVYFWNGSNWIMGSTDTIPGGGLTKTLDGKIGVKAGGITTDMLADHSVSMAKTTTELHFLSAWGINGNNTVGAYVDIPAPAGCTKENSLVSTTSNQAISAGLNGPYVRVHRLTSGNNSATVLVACFH